ncbi:MAG: aminoglycoside phosphotransferase family protein [Chloroflexota bacterium]
MGQQKFAAVFQKLSISHPVFLGSGATSQVYAIGNGRVIRLMGQDARAYSERLARFYAELTGYDFPYALPHIEEIGAVETTSYIIERHLPGFDMSTVFPKLDAEQRRAALRSFLAGLAPIWEVALPEAAFGELLGWKDGIVSETWPDFLRQRTLVNLPESLPYLRQDVPDIERLVADFLERVAQLPNPEKRLVHGDYFFGNVMCDEVGALTAVFDFSPLTLVGDPWFDIAGALSFLRVYDFVTEADIAFAEQEINGRYGSNPERMALYTTYNCLYFANSKEWDPPTYRWCLYHLERYPFLT